MRVVFARGEASRGGGSRRENPGGKGDKWWCQILQQVAMKEIWGLCGRFNVRKECISLRAMGEWEMIVWRCVYFIVDYRKIEEIKINMIATSSIRWH